MGPIPLLMTFCTLSSAYIVLMSQPLPHLPRPDALIEQNADRKVARESAANSVNSAGISLPTCTGLDTDLKMILEVAAGGCPL